MKRSVAPAIHVCLGEYKKLGNKGGRAVLHGDCDTEAEKQMQEDPQHLQQGRGQSRKLPNKKLHPRRSPQKALEITHTETKSPYVCAAF